MTRPDITIAASAKRIWAEQAKIEEMLVNQAPPLGYALSVHLAECLDNIRSAVLAMETAVKRGVLHYD